MIPEFFPPQREVECRGRVDAGLLKLLRGRVPFEAAGYDKDGAWYSFEHALCTRYSLENSTGQLHYTLLEVRMVEKPKPCTYKPSEWIRERVRQDPSATGSGIYDAQLRAIVECLDRMGLKVQP